MEADGGVWGLGEAEQGGQEIEEGQEGERGEEIQGQEEIEEGGERRRRRRLGGGRATKEEQEGQEGQEVIQGLSLSPMPSQASTFSSSNAHRSRHNANHDLGC